MDARRHRRSGMPSPLPLPRKKPVAQFKLIRVSPIRGLADPTPVDDGPLCCWHAHSIEVTELTRDAIACIRGLRNIAAGNYSRSAESKFERISSPAGHDPAPPIAPVPHRQHVVGDEDRHRLTVGRVDVPPKKTPVSFLPLLSSRPDLVAIARRRRCASPGAAAVSTRLTPAGQDAWRPTRRDRRAREPAPDTWRRTSVGPRGESP